MSSLQKVLILVGFLCLFAIITNLSKQAILQGSLAPTSSRGDPPLGTLGPQVKTLRLKYILHDGGEQFPGMLRRLDIDESELRMRELASGVSFTHTIRAVPGKSKQPRSEAAAEEFQRRSRDEGISTLMDYYQEEDVLLPDVRNVETLVNLAKITYNAYIPDTNKDWYDIGKRYNTSLGFGWEGKGLRGYVFTDTENDISIVALKGTSFFFLGNGDTVHNDKQNDNLMFSCCCARVGPTWSPVCDCFKGSNKCDLSCVQEEVDGKELYYNAARNIVMSHIRNSTISSKKTWLVGHSLGGALSSLVGLVYGLPAVGFEAPGERMIAARLHLPAPPAFPYEDMKIWHLGHTADPIFMGACNGVASSCWVAGYAMESKCHLGRSIVYDTVGRLGWGLDIRRHQIQDVIEKILPNSDEWAEVPKAEVEDDCEDCGLWEWVNK